MEVRGWKNTSTIILILDETEAASRRVTAPDGRDVLPMSLTISWVYLAGSGTGWGPATWVLAGSLPTGERIVLTPTDVGGTPAWIGREIDHYHPGNYEG